MTKYACGHMPDTIIADDNILTIAAYIEWKDSVGFDGDKSKCWDCYCGEANGI